MHHFHITFGTYGTRLQGGEAPTVNRLKNKPDDDYIQANPKLLKENRDRMKESPCFLSREQRLYVEEQIVSLCERGGWLYHVAAARPQHIHVLVSTEEEPRTVRKWLKTWLSQLLNIKYWKRTWFAKDGSIKWVNDDEYLENVFHYIAEQRTNATRQ